MRFEIQFLVEESHGYLAVVWIMSIWIDHQAVRILEDFLSFKELCIASFATNTPSDRASLDGGNLYTDVLCHLLLVISVSA